MKILGMIPYLALAAFSVSTIGRAAARTSPQRYDMVKSAELYRHFRKAQAAGDLDGAQVILEQKMMPARPTNMGYVALDARLCFERGEYAKAAEYYGKFMKTYNIARNTPEAVAQTKCFEILTKSAAADTSPVWTSLPSTSSVLNPPAILERECQIATAECYFKTAKIILAEMKKIGAPAESIANLQKQLDEQELHQKHKPQR